MGGVCREFRGKDVKGPSMGVCAVSFEAMNPRCVPPWRCVFVVWLKDAKGPSFGVCAVCFKVEVKGPSMAVRIDHVTNCLFALLFCRRTSPMM